MLQPKLHLRRTRLAAWVRVERVAPGQGIPCWEAARTARPGVVRTMPGEPAGDSEVGQQHKRPHLQDMAEDGQ